MFILLEFSSPSRRIFIGSHSLPLSGSPYRSFTDLMAYVDKLVDTQDAVMHDFNREDNDDGGNTSRSDLVKPM
jgi:hypothetical protein